MSYSSPTYTHAYLAKYILTGTQPGRPRPATAQHHARARPVRPAHPVPPGFTRARPQRSSRVEAVRDDKDDRAAAARAHPRGRRRGPPVPRNGRRRCAEICLRASARDALPADQRNAAVTHAKRGCRRSRPEGHSASVTSCAPSSRPPDAAAAATLGQRRAVGAAGSGCAPRGAWRATMRGGGARRAIEGMTQR